MKKRILSLLMAFVMVVSLLPASVRAAETVSSAKEFAAMSANGSYKLTQDIEVTTPYKSTFRGTFDGDGHTVTLKLNVTSGNAGLFATTGQGAVIKNVEVSADVTSNVASSSYGTAGLVGKVSGATTITFAPNSVSTVARRAAMAPAPTISTFLSFKSINKGKFKAFPPPLPGSLTQDLPPCTPRHPHRPAGQASPWPLRWTDLWK